MKRKDFMKNCENIGQNNTENNVAKPTEIHIPVVEKRLKGGITFDVSVNSTISKCEGIGKSNTDEDKLNIKIVKKKSYQILCCHKGRNLFGIYSVVE